MQRSRTPMKSGDKDSKKQGWIRHFPAQEPLKL